LHPISSLPTEPYETTNSPSLRGVTSQIGKGSNKCNIFTVKLLYKSLIIELIAEFCSVRKTKLKRSLGKPNNRWNNIKIRLKRIGGRFRLHLFNP
jgi:hypothetical protein